MNRFFVLLGAAVVLAGCAAPDGPATHLEKANVLPLALSGDYQFRKVQQTLFDVSAPPIQTVSEPAIFERARMTWGAIDSNEVNRRSGNYFNFFWRARQTSDVTVRFEYRQAGLGNYVIAQERIYPGVRGSRKSAFEVTGDQYLENGRVTSWRVLLIVDGKIVAFRQSFLWR